MNTERDKYYGSRILYIIEAAVEYFIAILVGTTYLAKLCTEIGISDSTTGILTSFISLGFGFQFFALFVSCKNGSKRLVTLLALLNQAAFSFLYLVPIFNISSGAKTAIFITLLLLSEVIKNVASPIQATWLNNLIDDDKRGVFTAKKEIISLISGMIISLFMGRVIDSFEAKGELRTAFILGGITLFVLTAIHTGLLLAIKERPVEQPKGAGAGTQFKEALTDKNLLTLIPLFIMWNMANYSTTPFYGTYQIKDLGFSMTYVAILAVVYAVVRAVASIPMGKLADRFSFVTMLTLCYGIAAASYLVNVFTSPENGHVMYTIYYAIHAVSMAGINSAATNLVYDYVPRARRTGSLAVKNTFAGFAGFFTTLAVSPLVDHIQNAGNKFLGIGVYAQQVLSLIGLIITVLCILYLNLVVKRLHKPSSLVFNDGTTE